MVVLPFSRDLSVTAGCQFGQSFPSKLSHGVGEGTLLRLTVAVQGGYGYDGFWAMSAGDRSEIATYQKLLGLSCLTL